MRHGPSERAVVYLRKIRSDCRCHERADRHGYRVVGMMVDPDGTRYQALQNDCMNGAAEVILVCSRSDLPAERIPRVESDTQDLPPVLGEETLRLPSWRKFRRPNPRRLQVIAAFWVLILLF